MQGTIKFYNKEKGYGFIYTNEHDKDIYFRISQWKNPSVPNGNDDVSFETKESPKGLEAINITCTKTAEEKKQEKKKEKSSHNEPLRCLSCGNYYRVPRMITFHGTPQRTVCPHCGKTIKDLREGYCFIATSVYGDYNHPKVQALRHFRDNQLTITAWGRNFTAYYYKKSPAIATKLKGMPLTSAFIRGVLNGFVYVYITLTRK